MNRLQVGDHVIFKCGPFLGRRFVACTNDPFDWFSTLAVTVFQFDCRFAVPGDGRAQGRVDCCRDRLFAFSDEPSPSRRSRHLQLRPIFGTPFRRPPFLLPPTLSACLFAFSDEPPPSRRSRHLQVRPIFGTPFRRPPFLLPPTSSAWHHYANLSLSRARFSSRRVRSYRSRSAVDPYYNCQRKMNRRMRWRKKNTTEE